MKRGKSKAATAPPVVARKTKSKRVDDRYLSFFPGLKVGFKAAVVCALVGLASVALLLTALYPRNAEKRPRAITPFPSPKIMDLPQFRGEHEERLFWGTYRPHIYCGIRSRSPKSLLAGLMWLGVKDGYYSLRHSCESSDGLKRYGWLRHDGVSFGRQEIVDGNVVISTSFLKRLGQGFGYGGDWTVRLRLEGESSEIGLKALPIFFYIAEEEGTSISIWPDGVGDGAFAAGYRRDIGNWELHVKTKEGASTHFAGFHTRHMHNLTQLVERSLTLQNGEVLLPDAFEDSPNVAIFQIAVQMPAEIDVVFVSGIEEHLPQPSARERVQELSGEALRKRLLAQEEKFEKRFQDTFNLQDEEYSDLGIPNAVEVGKAALSNLLGGISYFYGESLISIPSHLRPFYDVPYWTYWPAALYTAVPSRSFFPRGFLWDEGFHQLIVSKWDRNLTFDIVGHWLDLLNIDGWIPREQILGTESRARVPQEFILQHTNNANPPTLFLPLHDIALAALRTNSTGEHVNVEKAFLEQTFPRLEAWFNWFNTTQAGLSTGTYYWHGRDPNSETELNAKSLSSGLDDYPRASHPDNEERHVDLRCWLSLAANTMVLISKIIGVPHANYEATANLLSDFNILNELHYDRARGRYYDYGYHTEKVKLDWQEVFDKHAGRSDRVLRRVVYGQPKYQFVPHFGYVSLFPFIMKLIPVNSPILLRHLELIRDERLLWTNYGLRSLAKTSSMYNKYNTQHDPPYWRGSVWINFNYLVLASLKHYSQEEGPYQQTAASTYKELRENLIRNILRRYNEGGYLFEQYDNNNEGAGKGARPFTGWTSLLVLIMAEKY